MRNLAKLLASRRKEKHIPPSGHRAPKRWGLRGIAERLGVARGTVHGWERGALPDLRIVSVEAIARAYTLDPATVRKAYDADATKASARRAVSVAMLLVALLGSSWAVDAPPTYRPSGLTELLREEPPTLELHPVIALPSGAWIQCNQGACIPVYLCDPAALGRRYLVMSRGLAVFIATGDAGACRQVARLLRLELPERTDLAELVGTGAPDALLAALRGAP